ncbi:ParB N-terminal domain-containing protein, partial [Nodularia sp. UHCC 0506]|uniref:ParB N-terminal domain-containing protein n=1 Tax=Nodularia sp. UHCC 0506 TaxID=3110243 RepID=UPI002B1F25D0
MTNFLMVDVAGVTSSVPRSKFAEADLNILADKILESGGLLKPLVLRKIGFEKYEVIDGHFEYYAAVRAREKNSDEGEMVNALIIPSEQEEAVLKQAVILKSVDSANKVVNNVT